MIMDMFEQILEDIDSQSRVFIAMNSYRIDKIWFGQSSSNVTEGQKLARICY